MLKLLRIDLDKQNWAFEELSSEYEKLGGRALSSQIINKEVPPKVDALDPGNKLIFAAGILAGTNFPNSGRLSVGAKSPLTGGIKEANAGGQGAQVQARLGYAAIVLEGKPKDDTLYKVFINKDGVEIIPDNSL
ncbi:MAG: aldehyde ferredoxin oxidoreductase, partial [Desulfobacula sp.]|nr:aldehyde ferredoxin oxidoreductase [Desulfobacula sp.]